MTTQTPDLKALADKIEAWSPSSGMLVFIARERRMLVDALRAAPEASGKCTYPKCECGDGFHVCPEATDDAPEASGAEPVAWQYRYRLSNHWADLGSTQIDTYRSAYREEIAKGDIVLRPLYASPPPADMRGTEDKQKLYDRGWNDAINAATNAVSVEAARWPEPINSSASVAASQVKSLRRAAATPPVADAGIAAPPTDDDSYTYVRFSGPAVNALENRKESDNGPSEDQVTKDARAFIERAGS